MILAREKTRQKRLESARQNGPAAETAAQDGKDGAHGLKVNGYSSGNRAFCLHIKALDDSESSLPVVALDQAPEYNPAF